MFDIGRGDALRARRFLWRHGDDLADDLLDHKEADLRGKAADPSDQPVQQLERLAAFRRVVDEQRSSPHRLRDLAVDGDDLLALGYEPGPKVGYTLGALLEAVIGDPALNDRDKLLERAEALR
jgi:tRNA nucleotidyltransferase (CCA-adding enzyme)